MLENQKRLVVCSQMNIVERAQLKMEKISRLNMGDYLCVAR